MQIEFDWKGFEEQCKGIVHDTNEKFIDLGQDDGPQSAYGDGLMQKQEKFKKEFDKLNF